MIGDTKLSREQQMIRMRYGFVGYRCLMKREVSKSLDRSRYYVSRIEKKALEKLKEEFEKTER